MCKSYYIALEEFVYHGQQQNYENYRNLEEIRLEDQIRMQIHSLIDENRSSEQLPIQDITGESVEQENILERSSEKPKKKSYSVLSSRDTVASSHESLNFFQKTRKTDDQDEDLNSCCNSDSEKSDISTINQMIFGSGSSLGDNGSTGSYFINQKEEKLCKIFCDYEVKPFQPKTKPVMIKTNGVKTEDVAWEQFKDTINNVNISMLGGDNQEVAAKKYSKPMI